MSDQPLYLQIAGDLRSRIERGDWKSGEQLPARRQLAVDLRASPNTVVAALRVLEDEGYIVTLHGKGSYVKDRAQWEHMPTLTELAARIKRIERHLGLDS